MASKLNRKTCHIAMFLLHDPLVDSGYFRFLPQDLQDHSAYSLTSTFHNLSYNLESFVSLLCIWASLNDTITNFFTMVPEIKVQVILWIQLGIILNYKGELNL